MGLEQRPYIGTWQLDGKGVVQHSPDALVYLNGDVNLPGCDSCNSSIDVQKYITNVTVDASTDPGGGSASISLAVPRHSPDFFGENAQEILRPGLEVHVYMRGYFPIQGQFTGSTPESTGGIDIQNMVTYPYYHVFHGVVTSVDYSYSGGFQDMSISCASMLHFWNYHNMSENGAYLGAKVTNSGVETSMVGNRFNGWTPWAIIYTMFADTAGAAGDVAYVLKDRTNSTAKDASTGNSMFSMNIRYWKERFSQRMINLRMHGASGRVLSTPQAIAISRMNGEDFDNVLKSQWKGTLNREDKQTNTNKNDLNIIQRVHDYVTGEDVTYGIDAAVNYASKGGGDDSSGFMTNFASIKAFVQDVGQFGKCAIFETTYESKMDIVQKVVEVTGWEFFQDVDGDFVFKPPMYNLDTRSNKSYRIRSVDVISFNTVSKEPQATYVTSTSSHIKNLTGATPSGTFGIRGQYMDYKLIAQFGWRPHSFETAYFNDEDSLFFNSVIKLDVLNADMNSASLVIPLRPELRVGYPIYIEHIDEFYYVTGLNHQMTFGSQCTTSLTLTARRQKFHAPGKLGKGGISSIDMKITTLPRKPLEVFDNSGMPRYAGFPNVVMALDIDAINPMYFHAGFDLIQINDPKTLDNLLRYAVESNVLTGSKESGYSLSTSPTTSTIITYETLSAAATKYMNSIYATPELIAKEKDVIKKQEQVVQKQAQVGSQGTGPQSFEQTEEAAKKANEKRIDTLNKEIKVLQKQILDIKEETSRMVEANRDIVETDPDIIMIQSIIDGISGTSRKKTADHEDPVSTSALLSILSEKKTMFTNHVPGYYRYYSCSHPDPKNQGQNDLDGVAYPTEVKKIGFILEPSSVNGRMPEAELGEIPVSTGLNLVTPTGMKTVTTDEISTLSFVKHTYKGKTNNTSGKSSPTPIFNGINNDYRDWVRAKFVGMNPSDTIKVSYGGIWNTYTDEWEGPEFPKKMIYEGEDISGKTIIELENKYGLTTDEMTTLITNTVLDVLYDSVSLFLKDKYSESLMGSSPWGFEPLKSGDTSVMRCIDISTSQAEIDWVLVAKSGIKAVWVKASEGQGETGGDVEKRLKYFREAVGKAHSVGLLVGAYHFARLRDVNKEVQVFSNAISGVSLDLPYWLDMEPNNLKGKNRVYYFKDEDDDDKIDYNSRRFTFDFILNWVAEWAELLPGGCLYGSSAFLNNSPYGWALPLMVAAWPWDDSPYETPNVAPTSIDSLLKQQPSLSWAGWQYTSQGTCLGITDDGKADLVDLGLWRGLDMKGFMPREEEKPEPREKNGISKDDFNKMLSIATDGKVKLSTVELTKTETYSDTTFYSPVFPVSDGGGYTLIGGYSYGKGLQVMGNSTLDELASLDPLKFSTPEEVEAYLKELKTETKAKERVLASISANPSAPQILKDQIERGEDNISATLGTGILRVPVSNVALYLSNIQPSKKVCTCRPPSPDIYTEAYNSDNFLRVVPQKLDELSKFQELLSVEKGIEWQKTKNALAGLITDSTRVSPVGLIKNLGSTMTSAYGKAESSFNDAVDTVNDEIDSLDKLFKSKTS